MAKKRTTRRRSGGRKSDLMGTAMEAAGVGLGIVIARKFGPQLPGGDPLIKGALLLGAGSFLGAKQTGLVRSIAVGVAAQGAVQAVGAAFPDLGVNGTDNVQPLSALSPAQVDELERALLNAGAVNGPTDDYQEALAGEEDEPVEGFEDDVDDRNAVLAGEDDEFE